jgi:starch phosphorylase
VEVNAVPPTNDLSHEHTRTGLSREALRRAILDNLAYLRVRFPEIATPNDWYMALAYTVRDRLLERWIRTGHRIRVPTQRVVGYLSAEFLIGPQLSANLLNLGITEAAREAVADLGLDLDRLQALEQEPGLGNGGLGRLAACYLESLATLEVPAIGYGIRYEFGIFDQIIRDGWQVEITDKWLRPGYPWEVARPDFGVPVRFGGRTESYQDAQGKYRVRWIPDRVVRGVAYDTPILGYRVPTANLLRLWRAEAAEDFDLGAFNTGDYLRAVNDKIVSENISKVLYPNDATLAGKELRLEQQYFFVSCSLQDMLRIHQLGGGQPHDFASKFAIQMNDTHPSLGVVELMRLLVDEDELSWERAWEVTQRCFGYTNHTLLPEALERWPLSLFGHLLPRHLEIVFELNRRFLDEARARVPGDEEKIRRLSLIDESDGKFVRMASLACLGSHRVNGVAALHTDLLEHEVLRDFYDLWPDRFVNVTNGVSPRRFLALSNPRLAALLTRRLGDSWLRDFEKALPRLEPLADDPEFRREWRAAKAGNKRDLAAFVQERTGIELDPSMVFDAQVKRIHEYKRQHLNILQIVARYLRLLRNPSREAIPRAFLFGGKAAPGYTMAKLMIKLVTSVAEVVNADPTARGRMRVVFIPDFNVTVGQKIYPAADVSEQISTAGKEASGTGNMKFAMNGAVTIGTLDGANVEIREAVEPENFFLFGLTAAQVEAKRAAGYDPRAVVAADGELSEALDRIASGFFSKGAPSLFRPLVDSLLDRDEYMLLADFASYREAQDSVDRAFRDEEAWARMSIRNAARTGRFSSDRSIREYCEKIWDVPLRPTES